jgi:elongation factor P
MASILFSEVRKGMVIVMDGELYYVLERDLRTPGNLPSKLTLKLKSLKTGFCQRPAGTPRRQGRASLPRKA